MELTWYLADLVTEVRVEGTDNSIVHFDLNDGVLADNGEERHLDPALQPRVRKFRECHRVNFSLAKLFVSADGFRPVQKLGDGD